MGSIQRASIWLSSFAVLVALAAGVHKATKSPLFFVRIVEVADCPDGAPIDSQTIADLASVPVNKISLFELNLKAVEKRLLTQPWIREVKIEKRFPGTVFISAIFRETHALVQSESGQLQYLDTEGKAFAPVNLSYKADMPVLTGFAKAQNQARIPVALEILKRWESSSIAKKNPELQISSLIWDQNRGFRVLVVYPIKNGSQTRGSRTLVDLGQEIDGDLDSQFERLSEVFSYLQDHSLAVQQIWADAGKKIVVKTVQGS